MPLEHAKEGTPGFGRNIATEIEAGKDPKQAEAIAYSMAGERRDTGAPPQAMLDSIRGLASEIRQRHDASSRRADDGAPPEAMLC